MLCQKCGQNSATTYYQQTVNGKTITMHLCSSCAGKLSAGTIFQNFNINDMFSGFLTNTDHEVSAASKKECTKCHTTMKEIMKTGKVGCDECYHVFYRELSPSIEKIHGKSTHIGKISASADFKWKKKAELEQLKINMQQAVQKQEFERAAEWRDKIKNLEEELGE